MKRKKPERKEEKSIFPKNSFLGKDGKRYLKTNIDVILTKNQRFFRTFHVEIPMYFDFGYGRYLSSWSPKQIEEHLIERCPATLKYNEFDFYIDD